MTLDEIKQYKLETEIERLTAREEQRAERLRLYMNRIGELEAEIGRLRAQVKEWEEWAEQFKGRALEPKP